MRRVLFAGVWLSILAQPLAAQEGVVSGTIVVQLADGTTLPMTPWSLSYEYLAWPQGSQPTLASGKRTESQALWLGKKSYSTAGATLEVQYDMVSREQEMEGGATTVRVPVARALTLTGPDGKATTLKPEAPQRDFLTPGAEKTLVVQPRSLDVRGQTLTGTQRDFCLLSYTTLVECNDASGQQVVKIQFPK